MLEVKGKMNPYYILVDPLFFMIFKVPGHVSKVELSPLVIRNLKPNFQAVLRNPSSFKPKDFIGKVGSDFSLSYPVGKDDLKPVAIEPTVFVF